MSPETGSNHLTLRVYKKQTKTYSSNIRWPSIPSPKEHLPSLKMFVWKVWPCHSAALWHHGTRLSSMFHLHLSRLEIQRRVEDTAKPFVPDQQQPLNTSGAKLQLHFPKHSFGNRKSTMWHYHFGPFHFYLFAFFKSMSHVQVLPSWYLSYLLFQRVRFLFNSCWQFIFTLPYAILNLPT